MTDGEVRVLVIEARAAWRMHRDAAHKDGSECELARVTRLLAEELERRLPNGKM